MNIYVHYIYDDHNGSFLVGVASVVVAENEEQARSMLQERLMRFGHRIEAGRLCQIKTDKPVAFIIGDDEIL